MLCSYRLSTLACEIKLVGPLRKDLASEGTELSTTLTPSQGLGFHESTCFRTAGYVTVPRRSLQEGCGLRTSNRFWATCAELNFKAVRRDGPVASLSGAVIRRFISALLLKVSGSSSCCLIAAPSMQPNPKPQTLTLAAIPPFSTFIGALQ